MQYAPYPMKVAIVGGGPAGLYTACALKRANPRCEVVVYEVRQASVHAMGLGYTLQHLGINLLGRLDPEFMTRLFPDQPPLIIREALYKTDSDTRTLPFSPGFSVERGALVEHLSNLAISLGVNIEHRLIKANDLKRLGNEADLVVGADGVNSVVRERYRSDFGAQSQALNMHYSWFINESPQTRTEACFYAFRAPEGVVMLTSYPLTPHRQVAIVEMSEACLNSGNFRAKAPSQVEGYLSQILSQNGDHMALRAAKLPWYRFQTNSAERLHTHHMALVGDAAMAFHYSAGQGVTNAFTMAFTLAQCLQRNTRLDDALQHYSSASKIALRDAEAKMLARAKWLEQIDTHFQRADETALLDLFLEQQGEPGLERHTEASNAARMQPATR